MPSPMRHRQRLTLIAIAAICLLPLLLLAFYVASVHLAARERLDQVVPRYSRLLGLEAAQPQIEQARTAVRASISTITYPATQEAGLAGNDAQEKIRTVFSKAQLDIGSSQVLPATTQGQMDRVPLSVRAEGDLAALQSALTTLGAVRPAILIDKLNIQGNYLQPDAGRLVLQFSFYVLRAHP